MEQVYILSESAKMFCNMEDYESPLVVVENPENAKPVTKIIAEYFAEKDKDLILLTEKQYNDKMSMKNSSDAMDTLSRVRKSAPRNRADIVKMQLEIK